MKRSLLIASLLVSPGWGMTEPGGDALIQIGVEVVEVDSRKTRQLGIEWISELRVQEAAVPSLLKVGTFTRDQVFADLQLMMEDGAADLLANPKLVARDGSTAHFRVGGEIPYAVASGLGTTTVEFKPYGITLRISPRLESSGKIALSVEAEVSAPDNQNSVSLSGNTVPGLRSRLVSTQLTLAQGTTLTMAGLVQNEKEWKRRGIPGLMHIPVLGYLFSRKVETVRRNTIVVFVTPVILEGGPAHAPLS